MGRVCLKRTALILALMSAGCAGLQQPVNVAPGQAEVRIEASSFSFRPNNLIAPAGQDLILAVQNTSGITHNITVESPDSTVQVSAALPPGETTRVTVPLREPGVYPFYCNKPLHALLGMKGQIRAR